MALDTLVFLDTETTDLIDGRLVELAYAKRELHDIHLNGDIERLLVKPPVPISFDAMATHHVTQAEVINQPFFDEHPDFPAIKKLVEENILVAHNAPFDIGVLEREGIKPRRYIDTCRVARHLLPESPKHQLQYLRYSLALNTPGVAHSADGDVAVLIALFVRLMGKLDRTAGEKIDRMEQLTKLPVLLTIVPQRLKKHAGKTFQEMNRDDHQYIVWACDKDWGDEDLTHTLKHWRGMMTL